MDYREYQFMAISCYAEKETLDLDLKSAYEKNDREAVKRLVDEFEDRKYAHNNQIFWALEYADEKELDSLILDSRTDMGWTNECFYCWSFMHQAASKDKVRIVDLLIKSGLTVNAREFDDQTPLFFCDSSECAQFLLDSGAELELKDIKGDTALSQAAYGNREDVLRTLIRNNANLYARNENGHTPLDVAKRSTRSEACVKILEEAMKKQQENTKLEVDKLDEHGLELFERTEKQRKISEQLETEKKELPLLIEQQKIEREKIENEMMEKEKNESSSHLEQQKKQSEQLEREQKQLLFQLEEERKELQQVSVECDMLKERNQKLETELNKQQRISVKSEMVEEQNQKFEDEKKTIEKQMQKLQELSEVKTDEQFDPSKPAGSEQVVHEV